MSAGPDVGSGGFLAGLALALAAGALGLAAAPVLSAALEASPAAIEKAQAFAPLKLPLIVMGAGVLLTGWVEARRARPAASPGREAVLVAATAAQAVAVGLPL
jgi:ammonia channel protein AmtB